MKNKTLEKAIISAIGLIAGSLVLEGLILIILQIMFHNYMSEAINIATIAIAICVASLLYPFILLKQLYSIQAIDVGVHYCIISSTLILTTSLFCLFFIMHTQQYSKHIFFLIVQNFFVAAGEEFVARGCLFYLLRKIVKKESTVIIISTIIFVFIFHSNSSIVDNLIWRLPITILLSIVYSKTQSIVNSGIIHMTYNVIVSL